MVMYHVEDVVMWHDMRGEWICKFTGQPVKEREPDGKGEVYFDCVHVGFFMVCEKCNLLRRGEK